MSKTKPIIPHGYWPCACLKRDQEGRMTAVKMHPPKTAKCRVCGCKRPPRS